MEHPAPKSIAGLFNKFAGREVPMVETYEANKRLSWRQSLALHGAQSANVHSITLADPDDPVLVEMRKLARDNGKRLDLKFIFDSRADRAYLALHPHCVTAYFKKGTDGKWRISDRFDIS